MSVSVDGKPLARLLERGAPYQVIDKKGDQHKLLLKAHFLDPVPAVYIDDKVVPLARPLHRVESAFAILPAGMFLGRGMLAVIIAYVLISTNFKLLRSDLKLPGKLSTTEIGGTLKWVLIYAFSLAVYLAYMLLAYLLWRK